MMTQENFSVEVRSAPGRAVLVMQGEINGFAQEELQAAYDAAEQQDQPVVLLDLHKVTYINSTGIALIVGLMSRARKAQRRLLVSGLNEHYLEIFRITRLTDYLEVIPDQATT